MGDPLTLKDLSCYLDTIASYGLKALLTTSGYFLQRQSYATLFHPAVKQINISLNSYNKNSTSLTLEQYLKPILALCHEHQRRESPCFINLRLWNLDEQMSERHFNASLFAYFNDTFHTSLSLETIYKERPTSIRLAPKLLLHFDSYFEWPSLENNVYGDGRCLGLSSHIGILADGRVVPCCLDGEGVITLGNLHEERLEEILAAPRAVAIVNGFKASKAVEELCQKCSYKSRFNLPKAGESCS